MNEIPYNQTDHYHCWEYPIPPCGQKIEHLKCCLCEKLNPKAMSESNKRCCMDCGAAHLDDSGLVEGESCMNPDCPCHSTTSSLEAHGDDGHQPTKRVLSESEITDLYNQGNGIPTTPSWEESFNREFSHVAWIPSHKEHIKAFIQSLLDRQQVAPTPSLSEGEGSTIELYRKFRNLCKTIPEEFAFQQVISQTLSTERQRMVAIGEELKQDNILENTLNRSILKIEYDRGYNEAITTYQKALEALNN